MRFPKTVKYLIRRIRVLSVVGKLETSVCIRGEFVVDVSTFPFPYKEKPKSDSKNESYDHFSPHLFLTVLFGPSAVISSHSDCFHFFQPVTT